MDNLMKLVTTALEWTRSGLEKRMCEPSGSSPPPSCLCCVMILLAIIDGADPDAPVEDQDAETKDRANGKEPERQTVQENEQQNTTKTVEMGKNQFKRAHHPNARFLERWLPSISNDLRRVPSHRWNVLTVEERVRFPQSRASSGSLRTTDAKCRPL
jgi:hypothetical protein